MSQNISSKSKTAVCEHCGKENPVNSKYCSGCGYELPRLAEFSNESNKNNTNEGSNIKHISFLKMIQKNTWWITFLFFIIIFILTNPNDNKHLEFLKQKVYQKLNSGETFDTTFINLIESENSDTHVEESLKDYIQIKNYHLLSLTKVKSGDNFSVISIGILGMIVDLEKVDIFVKSPLFYMILITGGVLFIGLIPILFLSKSKKLSTNEKIKWILPIILLTLLIEFVAIGPVLTFSSIKNGFQNKDSEKLSENIDFPKLRKNIKEQFTASVLTTSVLSNNDNTENNLFKMIASGIAIKIVDGALEMYLTPSGLISFFENNYQNENTKSNDQNLNDYRYSYDSMNKFSIWITSEEGEETRIVLTRQGLTWKVTNIIFPFDK